MNGDLHSSVTTDLGSSTQAIAKLRAEYAALGVEIRKASKSSDDLKRSVAKGLTTGQGTQKAGAALARSGGPLGSSIAQITGGAGGDGIFARLAVTAGLASLAFKVFSATSAKIADDAGEVSKRMQGISAAMEKAQESLDKSALGAAHNAASRTQLLAVGGPELLAKLENIIASGVVSRKEGESGLLSIYGKYGPGAAADDTATAALAASYVGVPFDRAAKDLLPFGPVLGDRNRAQQAIGNTAQGFYGGTGDPLKFLGSAIKSVFADTGIDEARRVAGVEGQAGAVGIGLLGQGRAERAARQALANEAAPEAAAMLQIYKENQKQTKLLQDVLDAYRQKMVEKPFWSNPISNLTLRYAAEIAENNLLREKRLQGAAVFNP